MDAACHNSVEDGPCIKPRRSFNAYETENENGHNDGVWNEDVDGADPVGYVVWNNTANDADAVDDEQHVERVCIRERWEERVAREGGNVKEGKVDAPKVLQQVISAKDRTAWSQLTK